MTEVIEKVDNVPVDSQYYINNIDVYGSIEKPYFSIKQLQKVLNIKSIRSSVRNFDETQKQLLKSQTGNGQKTIFLTEQGLHHLLKITRCSKGVDLLNSLDIKDRYKVTYDEQVFINSVQKAFQNEQMATQFLVNNFRIDLYFPKYKIAVEFDECQHNTRSQTLKDQKRQEEITILLDCQFIRIQSKTDVFQAINQIYQAIVEQKFLNLFIK